MASNHGSALLQDAQFWLPHQFLSRDDPLPGKNFPVEFCGGVGSRFFPSVDYGNGWRTSDLSSPGDSVVGSAEESDNEEDFIADLTRKVAQSTLEDDFAPRNSKGLFPSGSPKSTLCGGCACGHASSRGSHHGMTQMKSVPPPTLDVLYQAAGKVANMQMSQRQQQIDRIQYLQQQQRLNHLIHLRNSKAELSFPPYQASSQLPPPLQFHPPQTWGASGTEYGKADAVLSSSAWPTLQQAQQLRPVPGTTNSIGGAAGMRAVFLGSTNGYRRGSSGTGVFLPRRAGVDPEPKKKQGCSTVLIPAKVVQALNLNLDELNPQPLFSSPLTSRLTPEIGDGAWRIRNGRPSSQHHQRAASLRGHPAVNPEISLPSEWTY